MAGINIYGNRGQFRPSMKGIFAKEMNGEELTVASEMWKMYKDLKTQNSPLSFGTRFDILKTMAQFLYPKPNLNINVTQDEVQAIPPELENTGSDELKALLPPAANDG